MTASVKRLVSVGSALVLAACAAKVPYNPYQVPREQFYGQMRTVAVGPVFVPRDLDNPDPVRQKFQTLIYQQLRDVGVTVVPSEDVQAIWDSVAGQMNGFYDPVTGQRDEAKIKTVRMHLYHELKAKYAISAMVFPSIAVVPAKLDGDRARWDGASQGAAKHGFWKAVAGVSHSGTIPALSLRIVLSDTEDTRLYENAGGIQVLAKADIDGLRDVPRGELFVDHERNSRAVHLALDPLLHPVAAR